MEISSLRIPVLGILILITQSFNDLRDLHMVIACLEPRPIGNTDGASAKLITRHVYYESNG